MRASHLVSGWVADVRATTAASAHTSTPRPTKRDDAGPRRATDPSIARTRVVTCPPLSPSHAPAASRTVPGAAAGWCCLAVCVALSLSALPI